MCIQNAKLGVREIFEQKISCLEKSRWNLPLPQFCAKPDNLLLTWEQFPSRSHNVSFATAAELKSKSKYRLLRHLLGNDILVWVCVLLWQLSYLCLKHVCGEGHIYFRVDKWDTVGFFLGVDLNSWTLVSQCMHSDFCFFTEK